MLFANIMDKKVSSLTTEVKIIKLQCNNALWVLNVDAIVAKIINKSPLPQVQPVSQSVQQSALSCASCQQFSLPSIFC